ncbi:MAG: VWA domain-containing protein [Chloracidobacterium sp.]|nr:VWA domain-containing protein [Chloracidobacterium sp.]
MSTFQKKLEILAGRDRPETRLLLAALLSLVCGVHVTAQDEPIKVDTLLVSVSVTVLDRNGAYVGDLQQKDFSIFENGIEQPIAYFEAVERPITVFLVLDISGSMSRVLDRVTNGANELVASLRPDDLIGAYAFSDHMWELSKLGKTSRLANKHIKLRMDGLPADTMVYDAVDQALKKAKRSGRRTAIVLFSDGLGVNFESNKKENLRDAQETTAIIFTISFDTMPKSRLQGESEKRFDKRLKESADALQYLRDLAETTGGRSFSAESGEEIEDFFREIGMELRQEYSLGYYPSDTGRKGERRKIAVKVDVPGAVVRSRKEVVYQ